MSSACVWEECYYTQGSVRYLISLTGVEDGEVGRKSQQVKKQSKTVPSGFFLVWDSSLWQAMPFGDPSEGTMTRWIFFRNCLFVILLCTTIISCNKNSKKIESCQNLHSIARKIEADSDYLNRNNLDKLKKINSSKDKINFLTHCVNKSIDELKKDQEALNNYYPTEELRNLQKLLSDYCNAFIEFNHSVIHVNNATIHSLDTPNAETKKQLEESTVRRDELATNVIALGKQVKSSFEQYCSEQ